MTDEHAHIPTEQILQDIKDTEKEITDMEDEKAVLMRNPQQHKVRIYMIEGGVSNRRDFIKKLEGIIEKRK